MVFCRTVKKIRARSWKAAARKGKKMLTAEYKQTFINSYNASLGMEEPGIKTRDFQSFVCIQEIRRNKQLSEDGVPRSRREGLY